MDLKAKITAILVKHGESFLGEEGVDEAVCEAAASEIASKLEESDDIIVFTDYNVPHQFAVCMDRECGKIFNACNLEQYRQPDADYIKAAEGHCGEKRVFSAQQAKDYCEEHDLMESVFAGKCPYCKNPAKYLIEHENKIARASYKMADKFCNNINTMSGSTCRVAGSAFAEGLSRQHRTLQQEFGRSILYPILKKFAEMDKNGETDARNEAFCKLCSKLLLTAKDTHLPFI